jgi:hypothetical protein
VRDVRRSDTYAAEDAAFEGTIVDARPGGPALEVATATVLASSWWRTNVGDPAVVRRVQVRTARESHWAPATGTLAIDPSEPWYVVTHELAHVAAGACGPPGEVHGAAWRGWNVALVDAVFGAPFGRLLADSFARFALAADPPVLRRAAAEALLRIVPDRAARGGWTPRR